MRYKLIAFDYDGTLVDTLDFHTEIFYDILSKYSDISKVAVRALMGQSINQIFSTQVAEDLFESASNDLECYTVSQLIWEKVILLPNVFETLEYLTSLGIPLVIISNSDRKVLLNSSKHVKIDHFFTEIIGADYASPMSKEQRFKALMTNYQLKESDILYVGDTSSDILNAQSVYLDNCLILNETSWFNRENVKLDQLKPQFIIEDISKLRDLI